MLKYFIQGKNGTKSEWKTLSTTYDKNVAFQKAKQAMKQRRGRPETKWYRTRVAVQTESGMVNANNTTDIRKKAT